MYLVTASGRFNDDTVHETSTRGESKMLKKDKAISIVIVLGIITLVVSETWLMANHHSPVWAVLLLIGVAVFVAITNALIEAFWPK